MKDETEFFQYLYLLSGDLFDGLAEMIFNGQKDGVRISENRIYAMEFVIIIRIMHAE